MLDEMDLVPQLLERMHTAPRDQAMMFCRRALAIVMSEGLSGFVWNTLAELADDDALWEGPELPRLLVEYDLPGDRESLRQLSWANAGTQPRIILDHV